MTNEASNSSRLTRWAFLLQGSEFEVKYKKGSLHSDADALSRNVQENSEEPESGEVDKLIERATVGFAESEPLAKIKEEQDKDLFCRGIKSKLAEFSELDNKERKKFRHYRVRDGMLYRRIWLESRIYEDVIVVPRSLRKFILEIHHDESTGGHLGAARTYSRIHGKYFWPGLYSSVKNYVATCESCQRRKIPKGKNGGMLSPIETEYPFQRVACDCLGPLVPSSGKKHIIVLIDYFTKWVITKAVSNITAKTTAKFLVESVICQHGSPKTLITDQGRNFTGNLLHQLNEIIGIEHRFTTAYHPQANGQVERVNSVFANMLSHYVNEFHSN